MNMSKVIIAVPAKGDVPGNLVYLNRAMRFCLLQGKAPMPAARLLYLTTLRDDSPEHALAVAAGHTWITDTDEVWLFVDRGLSSGMIEVLFAARRGRGMTDPACIRAWAFDPERLPATTRETCRLHDLVIDHADESVVLPPVCVRAALAMGCALTEQGPRAQPSAESETALELSPAGVYGTPMLPELLPELLPEPTALKVRRLNREHAMVPEYMTDGAAGLDLHACIRDTDTSMGDTIVLRPGERRMIPCGIAVAIPRGFEGQVRARSGLAKSFGLAVVNSPGTIDSDYRGEIGALLINLGDRAATIRHGDRIAQLVISPVARMPIREVETLDETARGEGGFGSTGK